MTNLSERFGLTQERIDALGTIMADVLSAIGYMRGGSYTNDLASIARLLGGAEAEGDEPLLQVRDQLTASNAYLRRVAIACETMQIAIGSLASYPPGQTVKSLLAMGNDSVPAPREFPYVSNKRSAEVEVAFDGYFPSGWDFKGFLPGGDYWWRGIWRVLPRGLQSVSEPNDSIIAGSGSGTVGLSYLYWDYAWRDDFVGIAWQMGTSAAGIDAAGVGILNSVPTGAIEFEAGALGHYYVVDVVFGNHDAPGLASVALDTDADKSSPGIYGSPPPL